MSITTDGRREAGERTRERLVEATRELLADRGEADVSLRAITDKAGANVAAVSYHFGSKETLVRAAIEQSVARLVQEQIDALRALGDEATVDDIATAWTRPVVDAVAAQPCSDHVFMRVVGRTLATCSDERREQLTAHTDEGDDALVGALARALPDRDEAELRFRVGAANSVVNWVTTGTAGIDGRPAAEIERLLVPVIAGALGGARAR